MRMRMSSVRVFVLLFHLFLLGLGAQAHGQALPGGPPSNGAGSDQAARFSAARRNGVPNRYIVILEDRFSIAARSSGATLEAGVAEVARDLARLHAATPLRTWGLALPGFVAEMTEEAARALSRDPRVRFVEQDAYIEVQNVTEDCYQQTGPITDTAAFPTSPQTIVCADPQPAGTACFDNWGIDRIDEGLLSKRPDGLSNRDGLYYFDLASPGVSVHVYLLDTGITTGHQEFRNAAGASRLGAGVNATVQSLNAQRNNVTDNVGHGTHVAGIVGGMTYGVAKDIVIHAVKVSDNGNIAISAFVEGIDWILANRPTGQPAVASLSANGTAFQSLATSLATTRLVQSGVAFVQSAGNQNQLAANVTMVGSGFPEEIVIAGGMDERDGRWTRTAADPSYSLYCDPTTCAASQVKCDCGSNFGSAVDIWAPASHIVSGSRLGNDTLCWLSGTSMAAPHVAGTAALLLGRFPTASPSAVEKALKRNGTAGALTDAQITAGEKLLRSRFPATGGPVAGDDRFFTAPGTPVTITFASLLAGDFDWDRDPLSIVSFGAASSGQTQVLSDRVIYTPAAGFTGQATFTYTITDGHANNDTATVRVRVETSSLPPLAVDDFFTVPAGQPIYQPTSALLANDSSRNGRALNFKEFVRNPSNGILDIDFGGQRSYTPNPGFRGIDSYVYRIVEQDTLLTADATVYLAVGLGLASTPSPSSAAPNTQLSWTATATGLAPASTRYALFRKKVGTSSWIPVLTSPNWQVSNVLTWTPTPAEAGTWDIAIWAKDSNTPANMNTYGYAVYTIPGAVQVVTLTSTPSPAAAYSGQAINWTATATGLAPASLQYAIGRRPVGAQTWTLSAWQSSNVLSWTPAAGDVGSWEIGIIARDANTLPGANGGYGYAAYANPGQVQVVTPLTVSGTGSPASVYTGTNITWTATAGGGTGSGRQYALFRRKAGEQSWTPSVTAPAWQSSQVLSWTPQSPDDVATWEIIIWAKDSATPSTMNTYGFAAYYNANPVQVKARQNYPPIGWVDGYNQQHIWGWACDPDYPTYSNRVDIWSTSWQFLGTANASGVSASPINSACGGGSAHYFDFYHNGSIAPGTHFMVWSIDLPYATAGNDNRMLGGNGSIGSGTEFVIP